MSADCGPNLNETIILKIYLEIDIIAMSELRYEFGLVETHE